MERCSGRNPDGKDLGHLYFNGVCVLCEEDDSPTHEPIRRSSAPVNSHRVLLKWAEGAKNRQRQIE